MTDKYIRHSVIAPYIDGLLQEKRSNGHTYDSKDFVLNRFDAYCIKSQLQYIRITKDFLNGWMKRSETEGAFNQGKRISCVSQLLLFIATCVIQVHFPHDFCHFKRAFPHIFDGSEIEAFSHEVDSLCQPTGHLKQKRLAGEYKLIIIIRRLEKCRSSGTASSFMACHVKKYMGCWNISLHRKESDW